MVDGFCATGEMLALGLGAHLQTRTRFWGLFTALFPGEWSVQDLYEPGLSRSSEFNLGVALQERPVKAQRQD